MIFYDSPVHMNMFLGKTHGVAQVEPPFDTVPIEEAEHDLITGDDLISGDDGLGSPIQLPDYPAPRNSCFLFAGENYVGNPITVNAGSSWMDITLPNVGSVACAEGTQI